MTSIAGKSGEVRDRVIRLAAGAGGCDGRGAAEPGTRPDAGQAHVAGGGVDARYEQLRHAALHARGSAFPLGLGVLTGKGVTAWRRAPARLTCSPPAGQALPAAARTPPLPGPVAAELVHVLAAVAVALAGT
jgi:hypothetical protein